MSSVVIDTYRGRDVLAMLPNWEHTPGASLGKIVDVFSGIAVARTYAHLGTATEKRKLAVLCETKEDIYDLISFFDSKKGAFETFWLPSWEEDVVVTAAFSATDKSLAIQDIGYDDYWISSEMEGRFLMFQFPDGSREYRKVVSAPDSTTIVLENPIGHSVSAAELSSLMVSFVYLVRFSQDELEIRYSSADVAEVELSFTLLPFEVPTTSTTTTTTTTTSTTSSTVTFSTTTTVISSSTTTTATGTNTTSSSASTTITTAPPAYEDFTTYTEVDEDNDITVYTNEIDVDTMRRDAVSYVHKDFGASHFGDFEIQFEATCSAASGIGASVNFFGLTNSSFTHEDAVQNNEGILVHSSTFYFTLTRSGSTVNLKIYSDAARTNLLDILTVSDSTAYRYLSAVMSKGDSSFFPDSTMTLSVKNVEVMSP